MRYDTIARKENFPLSSFLKLLDILLKSADINKYLQVMQIPRYSLIFSIYENRTGSFQKKVGGSTG